MMLASIWSSQPEISLGGVVLCANCLKKIHDVLEPGDYFGKKVERVLLHVAKAKFLVTIG